MSCRYPIVPLNDWLGSINLDDLSSFDKEDVAQYLNEILEYYGPPCDFCRHFDAICSLGIRNTKYDLMIGPYEAWNIRKFCDRHEGPEVEDDQGEEMSRRMRNLLSCDAQTYGTGS